MTAVGTLALDEMVVSPITYGVVKPGDYDKNGIKLIRGGDVFKGKINRELRTITKEISDQYKRTILLGGELLVSLVGNPGEVALVPDELAGANLARQVGLVRLKDDICKKYVLYYLMSPLGIGQLSSKIMGSVQEVINLEDLRKIQVVLPSLEEQKSIASVLSSLDDKIDLLHRQNKTLETMAETLFRQWFVEGAGDWSYVELGSVIETTSGGTPSRSKMEYYEEGTINWVKSKELSGSFILDTEEKITETALRDSSAKLLPKNSILIAMYGATVGEYAIISKEMACNQAVCALKPNKNYPYTFLFMYVKANKEELINMAVGSAQQNISQLLIKQLLVPNYQNEISNFHEEVKGMFDRIQLNIRQINSLGKLRDNLLPKLMSGEVRVE